MAAEAGEDAARSDVRLLCRGLPLRERLVRAAAAESECAPTNAGAKFAFWHPDLVTLHVWLWYPNPDGLFAPTNPLVAPFTPGA